MDFPSKKKMDKNETSACSETQTLYHRLNSMYRNQVFYDLYQKDPPIRLGQNAKQTGNNLTESQTSGVDFRFR